MKENIRGYYHLGWTENFLAGRKEDQVDESLFVCFLNYFEKKKSFCKKDEK